MSINIKAGDTIVLQPGVLLEPENLIVENGLVFNLPHVFESEKIAMVLEINYITELNSTEITCLVDGKIFTINHKEEEWEKWMKL